MMDNQGNFTVEIVVVMIIMLLILGIINFATETASNKIAKNVENENMENLISETCDNLINNPGIPQNWEDFKSKRVGLAIVNTDEKVVPNSVSYFKLVELGNDYNKLVKKDLFNSKFDSSMELIPYETSISSVKIGSDDEGDNVYSVNRIVKCDFFKKFTLKNFQNEGKCNHNHNQNTHSCNYFKVFKGNLRGSDYYLLVDDSEKYNIKWSLDTTLQKTIGDGKTVTKESIYLNNEILKTFGEESSSVVFVHLNKKNAKAVLVSVPKGFDTSKLTYNYFTTQTCNFIIKAWN